MTLKQVHFKLQKSTLTKAVNKSSQLHLLEMAAPATTLLLQEAIIHFVVMHSFETYV